MPKKGKKGKKAAAEEAARLEAEQKAKAAEEKRLFEEQLVAREQALLAREEAIAKREQDAQALETDFRSKLEGLDAEVTLRARSGIAAAEASFRDPRRPSAHFALGVARGGRDLWSSSAPSRRSSALLGGARPGRGHSAAGDKKQ